MDDPALLAEFVAEAQEHLLALTDGLLALEEVPDSQILDKINPLFRAMHSIKGSAGFLGFHQIEHLAHDAEAVLDAIRKGSLPKTTAAVDLLLRVVDRLQGRVGGLPESEATEDAQDQELRAGLKSLLTGGAPPKTAALATNANSPTIPDSPARPLAPPAAQPQPAGPSSRPQIDPALLAEFVAEAREHLTALSDGLLALEEQEPGKTATGVDPLFRATHSIKGSAGFLGFKGLERLAHATETLLDGLRKGTILLGRPITDLLLRVTDRMQNAVAKLPIDSPGDHDDLIQKIQNIIITGRQDQALSAPTGSKGGTGKTTSSMMARSIAEPAPVQEKSATLRVPVEVIDRLMNLASELVLARNQALETLPPPPDARGRQLMQRISSVTTDLQQAVMLTRMQPAGTLFNRFPRMVRDLARSMGKRIHLAVSGSEVELDKSVLEKLVDPLNHLVRNACDHGLELPEQRVNSGKPEVGSLELSARQEGGQILVRITDDGRGIDPGRVKAKALERGLVTTAELESMSDPQAQSLVLKPGFSTADKVTDISGRGVGLDVVKTNLESIGGTLQIDSFPGKGTTFSLRLPLTLAIIPALVVRASGERVCLPQRDLVELVSIAQYPIRELGDRHVVELRGLPLEVIHLGQVLGLEHKQKSTFNPKGFLAVVRSATRLVALAVDELAGSQEIVVKPLHPMLRGLGLHGGATVLADGLPAPILDVEGVVRAAGPAVLVPQTDTSNAAPSRIEVPTQSAVIFAFGPSEQFAVPLSLLKRVDRVQASQVEKIGDRRVARLDSGNLLMIYPNDLLPVSAPEKCPEEVFLLTPRDGLNGRALVATAILDTTTVPIALEPAPMICHGVLGATRVGSRITLVVNPAFLLEKAPKEVTAP